MPFSVYCNRGFIIVMHTIFGHVNFDHLGKVLFTRFLHCEVAGFFFFFSPLLINI